MSRLIDLTGPTLILPVVLSGHDELEAFAIIPIIKLLAELRCLYGNFAVALYSWNWITLTRLAFGINPDTREQTTQDQPTGHGALLSAKALQLARTSWQPQPNSSRGEPGKPVKAILHQSFLSNLWNPHFHRTYCAQTGLVSCLRSYRPAQSSQSTYDWLSHSLFTANEKQRP